MQKLFTFLLIGILFCLNACRSHEEPESTAPKIDQNDPSIFPVTDFLKGQLKELDSMPVTPLKTITQNGKVDSVWVKRDSIRPFAAGFLTPVIDSASMWRYFSGKSFLDQSINAFTFSFDPKSKLPDDMHLNHWDVYVDPQKGSVTRVYLVKEFKEDSANTTTQLTWQTNQWCSIRTIIQHAGKDPEVKEERMTWNFEN